MGSFLDVFKAVASPATSLLDVGSSIATSLINRHAQKETNKANAYQNEQNREFSAQQAQLDRDFNAQQSDLQNRFNAAEAVKSRKFNAEQAQNQMKWEEEMWNKQNAYNNPSAQIARLKSAGINPNWMDGFDNTAGSVGSGSAATSSPASGSPASHGSVGAPGSIPMQPVTVENPLMMSAQIRLANAQAEKAENDANRTNALLPGELKSQDMTLRLGESQITLNEQQRAELQSRMDSEAATIKMVEQQTINYAKEHDLMSLDEKQKQTYLKYYEDELYTQLQHNKNQLLLDDAQLRYLASQIAVNYSQQVLNGELATEASSRTTNNYDVHLLNGIELKYKGSTAKIHYDQEKLQYSIDVAKSKTELRQANKRGIDSALNHYFDALDLVTKTVGNVFGTAPTFDYHYKHE